MSAMRTAVRETDERTTVTNKFNPQKVFLYATDFLEKEYISVLTELWGPEETEFNHVSFQHFFTL